MNPTVVTRETVAADVSKSSRASLGRERLDQWCEWGVLGLVLAIVVYSPLATGCVRPQDFLVVQWLTVGVLAVWSLRFILNPKHRLLWPWVCWPVLGFMAYAFGRYLAADVEYVARQECLRVWVYGAVFFATLNNLHRQETTRIIAFTVLGLGMALGLYAVVQYIMGSERVWHFYRPEVYQGRGSGTFINPNNLAGYLVMLLPLGLAYTLSGRFKDLKKIGVGYAALMIFAGVVVSFSLGGWAAAGVSLLAFFGWVLRQRSYRWQGVLMLAAMLVIAVGLGVGLRHPARGNSGPSLRQVQAVRLHLWTAALRIWSDHPVWGAGPGYYDYEFRKYRPAEPLMQVRPERVHNDYLNVLADYGAVGGLLVAGIVGVFLAELGRSWRFLRRNPNDLKAKRSNKASFVIGGGLGLLAGALHAVVDFNFHVPAIALLGAVLLALIAGHFRFATESYWHTVRWWLRVPVELVLLFALGFLGLTAWRQSAAQYWLGRAERNTKEPASRTQALERAHAVDPQNFEVTYLLGETLRLEAWEGGDAQPEKMRAALAWFGRSSHANPRWPYSLMRYGMCLDWLGEQEVAGNWFDRARALDPHGYYTLALVGWHHVQKGEWLAARKYFERSLGMNDGNNPIASSYLPIVNSRLVENDGDAGNE